MPVSGILGDVLRQRRIGGDVPARRRDRQRYAVEAVAGLVEVLALDDDLVARRVVHDARRDRVLRRLDPALVDLLQLAADADPINFPVGGEHADGDRNVVFALLAVGDVGEQERLAVLLLDAAAELPAHQGVHLGVLVDRPVYGDEQAGRIERADVVVQVRIGARRRGGKCSCGLGGGAALRLKFVHLVHNGSNLDDAGACRRRKAGGDRTGFSHRNAGRSHDAAAYDRIRPQRSTHSRCYGACALRFRGAGAARCCSRA